MFVSKSSGELLDNRLSAILLELQSRSSVQDDLTEIKILLRTEGHLEMRGRPSFQPLNHHRRGCSSLSQQGVLKP